MRTALIWLALFVAASQGSVADVIRLSPESEWFEVLHGGELRPGDEVILAPGIYSDSRRLEMNHRGEKGKPIVIRGKGAVLRRPDAKQNSINMAGCQHLEIHGLEITGGSAGIRIERKGPHQPKSLRFEDLHIHHVGGVAITANHPESTYESLVFRRNHIHHTSGHGEAFYLGANNAEDGSTTGVMFDSIIEGNYIHDLDGPGIQQGDGIEIKDGSWGNVIRDNVIHDTKYPGIIVYGTDGKTRNVIERNVIWNTGDHGIQAAADAIIQNNIIFDTGGCGIYSQDHQSARVGNLTIQHNTIVTKGRAAIRIIAPSTGEYSGQVEVSNNALYAGIAIEAGASAKLNFTGNAGEGRLRGVSLAQEAWWGGGNFESDFQKGEKSFFPAPGSHLRGKARGHKVEDDFNGTKRAESPEVGAYQFDADGNPGWKVVEGFKE